MAILYNTLYKIYFLLKRFERAKHNKFVKSLSQKIYLKYSYYFSLLLNKKYTKYFVKHPVSYGLNEKNRDEKYTISLTSFPARIDYVWITIETLMRQTFKPDNIVLYLAKSQFKDREIPNSLTRLIDKGLTIKFCDDLRSHKKYYYAFQEYPDDNIILADDDLIYPTDMVKQLVKLHKKYPCDIIASNIQVIGPKITSMPTEWQVPENYKKYIHCETAQAFTGAGSLYPSHWYSEELFNIEKINSLALTCDDLWLKMISLLCEVKTTRIHPFRPFPISIEIPNNQTLFSENSPNGENKNNICWKALCDEYDIV